jgi:hypothetical protein
VLLVGCEPRARGPRVTLRYHPVPGTSFRYAVDQRYSASGKEIGAVVYVTETVGARTDSGIGVSVRTDSARLLMPVSPPMDPRLARQLRQAQDQMTAQLRTFGGTARYDDRMQVIRASYSGGVPALTCPLGGGVTGLSVPLPEGPVGVGDAWRREFSFSSGMLPVGDGRTAPQAEVTYAIDTIDARTPDTTVVIGIETRLPRDPVPAGPTGAIVTFDPAGPRGEKRFSLTRGALIGGRLEGTLRAHLHGSPLVPHDTTVTLAVRCTLTLLGAGR